MSEITLDTLKIKIQMDSTDVDKEVTGLKTTLSKLNGIASKGTKGVSSIGSTFSSLRQGAMRTVSAVKKITSVFGSWFKKSNEYVESLNLFNIAMGNGAKEAYKYAKRVEGLVGIDIQEWMNYQGSFNQLAEGYGIASDMSNKMSKNLTQMAYDLSSFWNTDVSTAFNKLQSGMSGQIKGLKAWGINLSVAQLKETALAHGITLSTSKMTEAQKATLRYVTLMEKTTNIQGDLARTIVTPANALRIMSAQWEQAKRAMGQVISVIAVKVIPYFQALIQIITQAAKRLADFFGYDLPEIDYSDMDFGASGMDDLADSTQGAEKAAKELKKSLLGLDEINKLGETSSSSASSLNNGYDSTLGIDLSQYDYDFLKNIKIPDLEPFKKVLEDILWYAGAIGAGIAAWKISSKLPTSLKDLKEKLKGLSLAAGITLAVTGLVLEIKGIKSIITDGIDTQNLIETLLGGGALIAGGALIGKTFGKTFMGAGIGGIVAGIPMFITGIIDAVKNGLNKMNSILIPLGSTMAGAGVGAIIGSLGGPIGAGIGALIGLAVGALTDLVILIVQKWDNITAWFKNITKKIGAFFTNLWSKIKGVWNSAANWFDSKVIQPIANFFTDLWSGISSFASECWNSIVEFFSPAVEWYSELFNNIFNTISDIFYNIGVIAKGCWDVIKAVWKIVADWFDENVITPISTFFSECWTTIKETAISAWEGIKEAYSVVSEWINTNIIIPVSDLFTDLWDGFLEKAREAWAGVKKVFSTVATFFSETFRDAWAGIVKVFSVAGEIFVDIKNGVVTAFKSIVNELIKGINKVVAIPFNAINDALNFVKNISILGQKPFSGIKTISVPQIPLLASGGILDNGQMFIARERGPEMVGTIGNKSAVVNNEQIVAGISSGVREANNEQNALLREQNNLLRALLEKDTVAEIPVSTIVKALSRKNQRDGAVAVPVGV